MVSVGEEVLTKSAQLRRYGEVLRQYLDNWEYTEGCRKRPTNKAREAKRINEERDELEKSLNLHWKWGPGIWGLEIRGVDLELSRDERLWWVLPISSDDKPALKYLAKFVLPKVFPERTFDVRSLMVPDLGGRDEP